MINKFVAGYLFCNMAKKGVSATSNVFKVNTDREDQLQEQLSKYIVIKLTSHSKDEGTCPKHPQQACRDWIDNDIETYGKDMPECEYKITFIS